MLDKGKGIAKNHPKKRLVEDAAKNDVAHASKKAKKLGFEYTGEMSRLSDDPWAYADISRSFGGSSRLLPPPEEMEDEDSYQKVT